MQQRRRETWTRWQELIAEQSSSRQSIAAFCRERGVPVSQFFAWKKRLRTTTARPFLEVQLIDPMPLSGRVIAVALARGRHVLVEPGFAPGPLTRRRKRVGDACVTSLPSLRSLDRDHGPRIWLATEVVDMRCGFDRLAERVQTALGHDPLTGHLFLFRSRRRNHTRFCIPIGFCHC